MKTHGSDGQALLGDGVNAVRTNLSITTFTQPWACPQEEGSAMGRFCSYLSLFSGSHS